MSVFHQRAGLLNPTPSGGSLTFRSFSVPGTEGNIGTSTDQGLKRVFTSQTPEENWAFFGWIKNLQNAAGRTLLASTTGREQVYEGTADTLTCRSNNIATGTENFAYTADTWTHFLIIYNASTNQRSIVLNNGTAQTTTDASAFTTYELDDNGMTLFVIQDDGEDNDWDGVAFDICGINSASSLINLVPTDTNFSTASGGSWVEFTDWASYTDKSFGLGGTVASEFTSGSQFSDYSGNGNHFTQSGADPTGTNRVVDRSSDGFGGKPTGA
jgi:hypothetical protein